MHIKNVFGAGEHFSNEADSNQAEDDGAEKFNV